MLKKWTKKEFLSCTQSHPDTTPLLTHKDSKLTCCGKMIRDTELNEAEAKVHFYQIVSAIETDDMPVSSSEIKLTDWVVAPASSLSKKKNKEGQDVATGTQLSDIWWVENHIFCYHEAYEGRQYRKHQCPDGNWLSLWFCLELNIYAKICILTHWLYQKRLVQRCPVPYHSKSAHIWSQNNCFSQKCTF